MKKILFYAVLLLMVGCQPSKDNILNRLPEGEFDKLMAMTYREFDQTPNEGWRKYSNDRELQIRLVSDYIETNDAKEQSLRWHLGQLSAMNEQYEQALEAFKTCFYEDTNGDSRLRAWNYYVGGTIAFIENDRSTFDKYLDSLERNDNQMNLQVMLGLQENFGKSYKEAY